MDADNLKTILNLLNEDVLRCWKTLIDLEGENGEVLFYRRAYIRAVYSMIEGVVYAVKLSAFNQSYPLKPLTQAEMCLLKEETYDLEDNGSTKIQVARIPIKKNIRFAYKMYAKVHGADFELDVGGKGWQSFQAGLKIRDRLMHPKRAEDCLVSDDEVIIVEEAAQWFGKETIRCLDLSNKVFIAHVATLVQR
jgi:hypothetical protein